MQLESLMQSCMDKLQLGPDSISINQVKKILGSFLNTNMPKNTILLVELHEISSNCKARGGQSLGASAIKVQGVPSQL